MDKEDVELLVDKKIAEAKLLIAEKRLSFVLTVAAAILTLFGIILPLLLTFHSETKVDTAINKMEQGFKELAGKQLRKPKIQCYIGGAILANSVITLDANKTSAIIEIKNIGDGTADFAKVRLYLDTEDGDVRNIVGGNWWIIPASNDKPEFKRTLEYINNSRIMLLPVQDSTYVDMRLQAMPDSSDKFKNVKVNALLRVYYGEPIPMDIPFTVDARIPIAKPTEE